MSRSSVVLLLFLLLAPCCAVHHATGEKLYPEERRIEAPDYLANTDSNLRLILLQLWLDTTEWKQDYGEVGLYWQYLKEKQNYTVTHLPSQDTLLSKFIEREFFNSSQARFTQLTGRHKESFVRELFRLIKRQNLSSPYLYEAYWMQAVIKFRKQQFAEAEQWIFRAIESCLQVHEHKDLGEIYALAACIAAHQSKQDQSFRYADLAIANNIVQASGILYRNMPKGYAVKISAKGDSVESYQLAAYESLIHFYNNSRNRSFDQQHEELLEQSYFHRCHESFKRLPFDAQSGFISHVDSLIAKYSLRSSYKLLYDLCVAYYNDSIWNLNVSSQKYQAAQERAQQSDLQPLGYTDSLALCGITARQHRIKLLQGESSRDQTVERLDSIRNAAHEKISNRLWLEAYDDYVLGYYEAAMNQYLQHNYAVADSLLEVYFGLCEHPDTAMVLLSLPSPVDPIEPAMNSSCCIGYHLGESQLLDRLSHYRQFQSSNVTKYLLALPEQERDYAWNRMVGSLNSLHNASLLRYQSHAIAEAVYDNALHTRTLALASSRLMDRIAALPQSLQHDSLLQLNAWKWQEVASRLDSTEASIEVVMARPMDDPHGDATYYAVLLSGRNRKPQAVELCPSVTLDSLLSFTRQGNVRNIDQLYTWSQQGARLFNLCFAPLIPYLNGIEIIHIAKTGILNQINVNAIPCSEEERLMDRYKIYNVSSTCHKPMPTWSKSSDAGLGVPFSTACIYGGLDYYANTDASQPTSELYRDYRDGLIYLANSSEEADSIYSILQSQGCRAVTYKGVSGTEESVKAFDRNSPELLHFATHSFYIDDDTLRQQRLTPHVESLSRKMQPLRYTGLHLACSAPAWYGRNSLHDAEDGLLTAEEIARLDLSQTKLAVLSSCSSGLGKIDDVDGVIGLQRAFKRAGVQTLVMSLWPVPDEATQLLMQYFYYNLMTGENCHQALTHAMQKLRHDPRYEKPHYWAGFVVLD